MTEQLHVHVQTMVEVMKIMATSSKGSPACIATLSAPNPAAGHHQPTPLPETPGHPQAIWGSLLWGHCSFLLGPGAQGSACALQESISPSCVSSGSSVAGSMATSSKRAYPVPKSAAPRAPAPAADHRQPVPPQETLKHSSFLVSVGSLGPGVHKVCLSPLSTSGNESERGD